MRAVTHLTAYALCGALIAALAVACGDHPSPTAPNQRGASTPSLDAAAATAPQIPFTATFNGPPVPASCLGDGQTVQITGQITGWYQDFVNADGQEHFTEYDDFSGLSASSGGNEWAAAPGAHEIWSETISPGVELEHQGETPMFLTQGSGPNIRFVHRIHGLLLPDGELQVYFKEYAVHCIG